MPVGSVDSGLGDIDDGRGSRNRSSSEEKESLTPAQSRRKAQNRAAYVHVEIMLQGHSLKPVTDNAPSGNARNGT